MYQETIDVIKKTKTIATHIKNLGTIMMSTEDPELKVLIGHSITLLQQNHSNSKVKGKSTPENLYNTSLPIIKKIIAYCERFIQAKQPEWQVLALRHGWMPPSGS
ncbi:hypothetical protein PTR41_17805 [Serratia bockelmannii]|uniref:hypothetical protein n=1 Tax=Serratia bockelmannii TaxID=2703793 RepID=UPI00313B834C